MTANIHMDMDIHKHKAITNNHELYLYYHVPGGFAVGAEPVRRPGEAPREGVSSKNGWEWVGVMREIGALVQGDGWV